MKEIKFNELYMSASKDGEMYFLELYIASGHMEYEVKVELEKIDFEILEKDAERAVFVHAALHHPFQSGSSALTKEKQREYLDIILHASKPEVEKFLTEKDHGSANGAVSNMVRITKQRDQSIMRQGKWFIENGR
ncbi:hypothetical protein [Microbulbifer sp. Q7]|uniref:hypothetical protein n=1 Tax=Microbulbifer sp. Q7 TaxID=1785091 RepID=UPI00129082FB|nr:hypothetical protein [Microbulbifer sp. Q7]